jgi:D-glycerate 3-kinase
MNTMLKPILEPIITDRHFHESIVRQLETRELQDRQRSLAFGISAENVRWQIERRCDLFLAVIDRCQHFPIASHPAFYDNLWTLWLPLAMQLADDRRALGRPFVQGVLGGQGMGKTTLATMLEAILAQLGYRTIGLSIDDLYKTHAERQRLKAEDPRFIRRGPPGTHDIELGIQVLDRLRQADATEPIAIPRFDKSLWNGDGDRIEPEIVADVDIILFEGWFVGAQPVDPSAWDNPPDPIRTEADKAFARTVNERLREYLPLWERLDRLMVLYPTDYRLSLPWRRHAEHQAIAQGKAGMTDSEIEEFVQYFWKSLHPDLFIAPLTQNPNLVDLVVTVNPDRTFGQIYRPEQAIV